MSFSPIKIIDFFLYIITFVAAILTNYAHHCLEIAFIIKLLLASFVSYVNGEAHVTISQGCFDNSVSL